MTSAGLRIAALVLFALGWTALAFYLGDSRGAARVNAQWSRDRAQAAGVQAESNRRVMRAGEQLADSLSARDAQHQKDLDDAKDDFDGRVADLRSGAVRVSIPVRVAACTALATGAATTASEPAEARAELTPEAAATLEGIAVDGDSAIIDLNACIDRYDAARVAAQQLNAATP